MSIFSADELADLQATELSIMNFTATILNRQEAGDGYGGRTESWVAVGTTPCRIGAPSDKPLHERGENITVGVGVVAFVYVPVDTVLDVGDRLEVGTDIYDVLERRDYGSFRIVNVYGCGRVTA